MQKERRQFGRRKFYSSDEIKAVLRGSGVSMEGFVTDLSPAGAAVALPLARARTAFGLGSEIEVTMKMSSRTEPVVLRAMVVFAEEGKASGQKMLRMGLSFVALQVAAERKSERRAGLRFACSDFLVPSMWCEHPWLYQEKILFRVLEFGDGTVAMETSARNKILLKGMEVDAWLSLPGQNPVACGLRILRVGPIPGHPERFRVAARFTGISEALGQAVAGYCLMVNPDVSLSNLRKAGFVAGAVGSVLVSDYVHSEDEMKQVFKLRGEFDSFDKFARQVVCKVGGKVVSCARIVFNDGKRERSEIAGRALLPAELWNEGFLEVSRLAIHSDFEDTDVLLEMLRFVVRVGIVSQSRYLLMECDDKTLAAFQEMGAQKMNLRLAKLHARDSVTNIVRWDCRALQAGWGGSPSQWAAAFGPVLRSLAKQGTAPVASRARIRMALQRYGQTDAGKKALEKRKDR